MARIATRDKQGRALSRGADATSLDEHRRATRGQLSDRRRDRETQILNAAERLLARTPIHQLEVKEILVEADISRGTFYLYFSSKFDVISGLLARSFEEMRASVGRWLTGDDSPPEEQLRDSLAEAGAVWQRHRAVFNNASDSWHADPELKDLWVSLLDEFVNLFTEAALRDRDRLLVTDPAALRQLVFSLCWSTERLFYLATSEASPGLPGMDVALKTTYHLWTSALYRPD